MTCDIILHLKRNVMLKVVQAIILAAGKSKRFKTGSSKLTQTVCGQPIILYQTLLFEKMGVNVTVVVGHHKDEIQKLIGHANKQPITFVEQTEQKGTGHALACTQSFWHKEYILVCNGDVPLITQDIITQLYETHIQTNAAVSFVTAHDTNPANQYGRVVKKENTINIIEAKEITGSLEEYCCINAGIYLFNKDFLDTYIQELAPNDKSLEYYVTDLVNMASAYNLKVNTISAPFDRVRGVNTLEELWAAEHIKRSELIKNHMQNGVRFLAPQNTHVDTQVTIESGCIIGSGVQLTGSTSIGKKTVVEHFSVIHNTVIQDHVLIKSHCVVEHSTIHANVQIGPFAYLREHNIVEDHAAVGSFVELKKTTLGAHSKAKHLSYLGDATIGSNVNIGGGTITANHDGVQKHKTVIKDNAYVGANNTLVAPVCIEEESYTAAGSTITQLVPAHALAIARSRQVNKINYVSVLKEKLMFVSKKKKQEKDQNYHAAVKMYEPEKVQEP
ncbi:UDP-N-acetylglucosamine diphosphorylase/glucosamine-1-phosphate N-acetyltransferase [Candidatus Dependentiae bacterium]|nr:MAG: UDP-N-acetylglucosamine diphosphorylase/glucosamine-1-phosphate N-acetyltransferase [Candidatus Dependentiae bacterium]